MILALALGAALQAAGPFVITWNDETRVTTGAFRECLLGQGLRLEALDLPADAKMRTFRTSCEAQRATAIAALERDLRRQRPTAGDWPHALAVARTDERYEDVASRTFARAPATYCPLPVVRISR